MAENTVTQNADQGQEETKINVFEQIDFHLRAAGQLMDQIDPWMPDRRSENIQVQSFLELCTSIRKSITAASYMGKALDASIAERRLQFQAMLKEHEVLEDQQ